MWSPEDLLVGSVASCFVVTLVAVAERRSIPLRGLEVGASGRVTQRDDGRFGFTEVVLEVSLSTDPGFEGEVAGAAEAAERGCLVACFSGLPRAARARRADRSAVRRRRCDRSPSVCVLQRDAPRAPGGPPWHLRPARRGDRGAGGSLGAIDLVRVEKQHEDPRRHRARERRRPSGADRRRRARPRRHRGDQRLRPHLPDASRRQDRDRPEVAAEDARRPLDGVHARASPGSRPRSRRIPSKVWNLTIKQNTVAVVSDGTAVLGLGDIGPEGALPVMEGKAMLFKEFGGVDAFPICLATKDTDEIVATVKAIAPVFGGINLEDISAPRCFEIEDRLRDELDIPVFHDDQHGTAVVVLAALHNALAVVGKRFAGSPRRRHRGRRRRYRGHEDAARRRRLRRRGLRPRGRRVPGPAGAHAREGRLRRADEPARHAGDGRLALAGADVFIGLSQPGAVSVDGDPLDGGRRDRLRDGQSDPRGAAGGDRRARGRDRDGPLRLSEPDQQRARVPRDLPRRARRPGDDRSPRR